MNAPATPGEAGPQLGASESFLRIIPRGTGVPSSVCTPLSIALLVWLVRCCAAINLVCSLLPEKPRLLHFLAHSLPFEVSEGHRFRMFLLSMLLFLLAAGLMRGKKMAWSLTITALAVAPALHWGRTDISPEITINLLLIGILILHRPYFIADSDKRYVRKAVVICSIVALGLLIYGTFRLHDLRLETSGPDSWLGCLQAACELVLVHTTYTQGPQTVRAFDFFSVLRLGGTVIAFVGLVLILRPVLQRRRIQDESRLIARRLIDEYGMNSHDSYALLSDKSYHLTRNGQAVVPYVLSGNIAVAMGDPIGSWDMRAPAIAEFVDFCRRQDWEPVFYSVTEDLASCYQETGLSLFKIGEEALLQVEQFRLKGHDFQNLRTIRNRAHRLGIQFRWYNARDGVQESLERELAMISQGWLKMKRTGEMSFDMGSFSVNEIRRDGVGVAMDSTGKALAFASWRPFAQGRGRALDLMRALPHVRNVMDFVLVESIFHFKSRGIAHVNLGVAPLANTDECASTLVAEDRVVQFLFENLHHFYRCKSLFEFKRKYRPQWRGRYVAYRRGVHLPLVGLALVRVHAPEGPWRFALGRLIRPHSLL